MADAPDRIVARIDYDGDVDGQWVDLAHPIPHSFGRYYVEYIRADRITALQDQNRKLVEALTGIARQKKTDELDTEYDVECADFEGGYDAIIDRARAAVAEHQKIMGGN